MRATRALGFTLIELLVVISIVTLLIAILLPTLSQARDVSKMAGSLSNIRQIMVGLHNFAGDNFSRLPFHRNPTAQYVDGHAAWRDGLDLGWVHNAHRQGYWNNLLRGRPWYALGNRSEWWAPSQTHPTPNQGTLHARSRSDSPRLRPA